MPKLSDCWRPVSDREAELPQPHRVCEGDATATAELAREALTAFHRTKDRHAAERCVQVLGWCAAAQRRYQRAATLFGAADMFRQVSGAAPSYAHVRAVLEHYQDEACQALGVPAFDACVAKGAAMTVDDAVEYALNKGKEAARVAERAAAEPAQLTRRETEIAHLVGEGITNKEIASRLVISQRTAETHVEHILAKLGCSRTQIAAWIGPVGTQ